MKITRIFAYIKNCFKEKTMKSHKYNNILSWILIFTRYNGIKEIWKTPWKFALVKLGWLHRRINELSNAIRTVSLKEDIVEKIDKVKNAIDELGWIQDEYLEYLDEKDIAAYEKEVKWYDDYGEI